MAAMPRRTRALRATCSSGARGAARDIVLLNAGASLLMAGAAPDCRAGHRPRRRRARFRGGRRDARASDRAVERGAGGGVMTTAARGLLRAGLESDLLETIVAATRHTTAAREVRTPMEELVRRAQSASAAGARPFATRCVPPRRRESSPSASAGRRRKESCAGTTTRRRTLPPTRGPGRRRFRCSPSRHSSMAASTTWSRFARPSTCRCCARTSSSPSISCWRRSRAAPTPCC